LREATIGYESPQRILERELADREAKTIGEQQEQDFDLYIPIQNMKYKKDL